MTHWHIITGEYPPRVGGVADYTEQLAAGLAKQGCRVDVWCPRSDGPAPDHEGVNVHEIRGGFSPWRLVELGAALGRFSRPRTLLVQYVPNAFGLWGMNVLFCLWLLVRRYWHGDDVRVMFHEPFFYFARQSPRRNLLALVTRLMAMLLLLSSRVAYVSIPAWRELLRPYCWLRRPALIWLPIPATIPYHSETRAVADLRRALTGGDPGKRIVGHFGTYFPLLTPVLAGVLQELLRSRPGVHVKLLGMGGERFLEALLREHPEWAGRLSASGRLSPAELSLHLQACDLLIQPYPDGASSRRTSLMAGLANGVATLTTSGPATEPVWRQGGVVPLVPAGDVAEIAATAAALLADHDRRRQLGELGHRFYQRNFSLKQSIEKLLPRRPLAG